MREHITPELKKELREFIDKSEDSLHIFDRSSLYEQEEFVLFIIAAKKFLERYD